jgi:CheY-like chemotaxis protein
MTKPTRILVVEDDLSNQLLFTDLLELAGYEVHQAVSVAEGRTHLRQTPPSLVVMDIRIPGGGGELLLSEMKQDPTLANIPVIAVTAFAMAGDRERLLQAGFDGYLSKPIDTRSFANTIAGFVAGRDNA